MEEEKLPHRCKMKRGSSLSQIFAQLSTSSNGNFAVGCGRLFRADYLSTRGKWVHLGKLLTVAFIPILGGLMLTLYSLGANVIEKDNTVQAQTLMLRAISLGQLINILQLERDNSILYISKIGPGTKSFLLEKYENTDNYIEEMWNWPEEFASHPNETFHSKAKLANYLRQHRAELDRVTSDLYGEIDFYSDVLEFLMKWMIERIRESGFGNTWKSLVVFQKITRCLLDVGAERAYGAMFFAQGNFPNSELYDNYFRRIFRFNYNYRSSSFYSNLVDPMAEVNAEYSDSIILLRNDIKNSNLTGDYTSSEKAELYFDNTSVRMDYLYRLQQQVASRVINRINSTINGFVDNTIIYSVAAFFVFMACPVIMFFTEALTSSMQAYSQILVHKSDELNEEKTKTDSLIYQMLPKQVAERLKRKSKVESEFFKSVTVMFSSIVNFTTMTIEYSPMHLIEVLDKLYSFIDDTINRYDVYKVETINDTYMVVSGVPVRNGCRHASEIARLVLKITSDLEHRPLSTRNLAIPIQLLIGINTGPVSAGVVGTAMLRYCLFGDTVNIASRMKEYSQPRRIHISNSTYINLKKTGHFKMQSRGFITVKGKGEMNTFWLIGTIPGWNPGTIGGGVPSEIDSVNRRGSDSTVCELGTSNPEKPKFTKSHGGHMRKQSTQPGNTVRQSQGAYRRPSKDVNIAEV